MTDEEKAKAIADAVEEVFPADERAVFVITGMMFMAAMSPGNKDIAAKQKSLTLGLAKRGLTIEDVTN